jgi:broad specificity phosphatase PhoE
MRHGYAYHNLGVKLFGDVAFNMKEYKDAKLTSEGVEHSIEMGKSFKNVNFTKLYCSPLLRCIETMIHFINQNSNYYVRNKMIILDDRLMEPQGKYLCNIRKDKLHLEKLIINIDKTFNLSNVAINYNSQYKESEQDIYNKITLFMEELREFNNDDDVILVVSHYGWLNRFFQMNTGKGYEFINSEVKIIEI